MTVNNGEHGHSYFTRSMARRARSNEMTSHPDPEAIKSAEIGGKYKTNSKRNSKRKTCIKSKEQNQPDQITEPPSKKQKPMAIIHVTPKSLQTCLRQDTEPLEEGKENTLTPNEEAGGEERANDSLLKQHFLFVAIKTEKVEDNDHPVFEDDQAENLDQGENAEGSNEDGGAAVGAEAAADEKANAVAEKESQEDLADDDVVMAEVQREEAGTDEIRNTVSEKESQKDLTNDDVVMVEVQREEAAADETEDTLVEEQRREDVTKDDVTIVTVHQNSSVFVRESVIRMAPRRLETTLYETFCSNLPPKIQIFFPVGETGIHLNLKTAGTNENGVPLYKLERQSSDDLFHFIRKWAHSKVPPKERMKKSMRPLFVQPPPYTPLLRCVMTTVKIFRATVLIRIEPASQMSTNVWRIMDDDIQRIQSTISRQIFEDCAKTRQDNYVELTTTCSCDFSSFQE